MNYDNDKKITTGDHLVNEPLGESPRCVDSVIDTTTLQMSPQDMISSKKLFDEFKLTPDELLARRKVLQVNEAAYILNVSPRTVRNMIHEGELRCIQGSPMRVPVEAVKELVEEVDLWESPTDSELDAKAIALGLKR